MATVSRDDYALQLEEARARSWAYTGFDEKLGGWLIPYSLLEPHDHLRDPQEQRDMFDLAVGETAKMYDWCIGMPNLAKNRILKPEQAIAYRDRIHTRGRRYNRHFQVSVPFYMEQHTAPEVVEAGFDSGAWNSGKIYAKNGTTNSDQGVDFREIETIFPALEVVERHNGYALVHGEMVHDPMGQLIADRLREPLAIETIDKILRTFPKLRLVFEHLSSKEAVAAIRRWKRFGYRVEATIAPHYLLWNSTVLFERGMNPVRYSIPILKDEEDRLALVAFLMEGFGMAGKDSAPHDVSAKSKPEGCPGGVFSAPVGLYVYFHLFRVHGGHDWFEKFIDFQCRRAALWYDLGNLKLSKTIIREEEWTVPLIYVNGTAKVIPLFAGKQMPYKSQRIAA